MNNVLPALVLLILPAPTFGDTEVSSVHVTLDESSGEPDYARLTIHDKRHEDPAGWMSLTCNGSLPDIGLIDPTPDIDILAFGTRPAGRRERSPVESAKFRVDGNPHRQVQTEVMDSPSDGDMRAYTSAHDLPMNARVASEFVGELSRGQQLIAQIGDVQPVVHLDLATARPDIVEFKGACDQMHAHFQGSPDRLATIHVTEVDPFTDRGRLRLQLHHRTSHDGGPQPMFFVQCQNDSDSHGLEVIALVPPGAPCHPRRGRARRALLSFGSIPEPRSGSS